MTVHSCEVPGCNAPAQWARCSPHSAESLIYLCTPHWTRVRGGSWLRLEQVVTAKDAVSGASVLADILISPAAWETTESGR